MNERTAGICVEWIQGEGGVNPLDHAFLRRARELADRFDALLCFDEIQCGVGRTGKYFGYQLADPPVIARHHDGGQADRLRDSAGNHRGQ